jgi:hypothetical protein
MGLFLAMSGVMSAQFGDVETALGKFALSHNGEFRKEKLGIDDDDCLIISQGPGGVTVHYPATFFGWDAASAFLSQELDKPVFSFHIHDGDLWMYVLFAKGQVADRFNPLPGYWDGDINDDERRAWRGNAVEIAKHVHGLSSKSIARYLVPWDDEGFESNERTKAYPDDEFFYNDDWQLVDFMKRVGLDYPIDDEGTLRGATYFFRCSSNDSA